MILSSISADLGDFLRESFVDPDLPALAARWHRRARGYGWFLFNCQGQAAVLPTDREIDRMMDSGELNGDSIAEAVEEIMDQIGNPAIPAEVDFEKLFEIVHSANLSRIRRRRSRKPAATDGTQAGEAVEPEEEEDLEEEDSDFDDE